MSFLCKNVPLLAFLLASTSAIAQQTVTTTGGTSGVLPVFSGSSSIINSKLYYTNGNLGIGKTPAAALNVSGIAFFGGQVVVEKGGTATSTQSANSHSLQFQTSAFNSSSKVAVSPYIEFLAEATGSNTASPAASLHLLTGTGTGAASESGFYINSNGVVHFASAQTFPITQGAAGPTGPQGPAGPSGTAGPNISVTGTVSAGALVGTATTDSVIPIRATTNGTYSTALEATNNGSGGVAIQALSADVGVYSYGAIYAGEFYGNVFVNGALSKSGGSFKIDDPIDPENKYLSHSFVESPDMMNIYNGNVITDSSGLAIVTMPNYFVALNRDFRYQLTVMGQFAQAIVGSEMTDGAFTIRTDKPNVKVSWMVTGIRQDPWANAHRIPNEESKAESERGKLLHPELYGKPAEMGIMHTSHPQSLQ